MKKSIASNSSKCDSRLFIFLGRRLITKSSSSNEDTYAKDNTSHQENIPHSQSFIYIHIIL